MFDFVEQPVTIRNGDIPVKRERFVPVVQQGMQTVLFEQGDVRSEEYPQPLFSIFRRKKKAS